MYLINKSQNRISKLEERTFKQLGFYEREHLQEWLANTPEALGEEILIIQKEFDGFNDTHERLDLLGLDKQGNLVIIENKLDDTGRDVTWQVLKYASYCSTLKKEQIRQIYQNYLDKMRKEEKAEDNLMEFFGVSDFAEISLNSGQTQRIILVARNFRKEVTSTVLWLLNYKLRIQCFMVTPYQLGEQLFLNIEQIIPMQASEEYIISMADKTQEDINLQEGLKSRHHIRIEFWNNLLPEINKISSLFQNVNPTKDHWLTGGSGLAGVNLNFVISNYYARAEVYASRSSREENKFIFDELFRQRDQLEEAFGGPLIWERLDEKKAARIKAELGGVDYFNKEDWPRMIAYMVDAMARLDMVFRPILADIKRKMKNQEFQES